MSRIRLILASLVFATTASASVPTPEHPTYPDAPEPSAPEVEVDRAAVRAKLALRRDRTAQHFFAYRDAQTYPVNTLPGGGFRHVWIDGGGNLCAAATLISKDWGREAAIRVGASNVELRLADVKHGPVADWILMSGLTRAEIVAIQMPGFAGPAPIEDRSIEVTRMFQIYTDVERQMRSLWDENLELATDALMKHPDLARALLRDQVAPAREYGREPRSVPRTRFSQPPAG